MGIWSDCGKMDEFGLSAENPRQKGPICPRTKKKAPERASVSVLFGLDWIRRMVHVDATIPAGLLTFPRQSVSLNYSYIYFCSTFFCFCRSILGYNRVVPP